MSESVQNALAALRDLGSVEQMRALAAAGTAPAVRPRGNSHIHLPPNFSAFESIEQAVALAAEQGVGVMGVSNYYYHDVYGEYVERARTCGIFPLFGLEIIALIDDLVRGGVLINDPGNPGRIYICGKGITRFDDLTDEAGRLMNTIRRNDTERMAEMTAKLAVIFAQRGLDTGLDDAAVIDMVMRRHDCPRELIVLQERHIAQAFQEELFRRVPVGERIETLGRILGAASKASSEDDTVTIQTEIRSHLMKSGKPAFVAETFVNFDEAHRLILELGGIPCYPTLADGTSPICAYETPIDQLIDNIRGANVHMAEFIPIRNTPEVLTEYVKAMRAAGLAVVGGTEHNTLDLLPIEPTCIGGAPVPDEVQEIFWEGACVAAAHQFLTLHGECGFVDAAGEPNAAYETAEDRIEAFAKLGAAVIQRYYESNA
jgi:hypothetical protein